MHGDTFVETAVVHIRVPKQPVGSNNCALFMLNNMKLIYQNPDVFLERAMTNSLGKH